MRYVERPECLATGADFTRRNVRRPVGAPWSVPEPNHSKPGYPEPRVHIQNLGEVTWVASKSIKRRRRRD